MDRLYVVIELAILFYVICFCESNRQIIGSLFIIMSAVGAAYLHSFTPAEYDLYSIVDSYNWPLVIAIVEMMAFNFFWAALDYSGGINHECKSAPKIYHWSFAGWAMIMPLVAYSAMWIKYLVFFVYLVGGLYIIFNNKFRTVDQHRYDN